MMTSLDHSLWFHAPFRADAWVGQGPFFWAKEVGWG